MKVHLKFFLLSSIIYLITAVSSCKEAITFPDQPIITSNTFRVLNGSNGLDSALVLDFGFTDGDADIGLGQRDTVAPFDINFFIEYFEKKNGLFSKVLIKDADQNPTGDTLNYNGRIPFFNSVGGTKSVQGRIEYLINIQFRGSDTLRFDYFIVDRKLNRSNKVSSGPVILK